MMYKLTRERDNLTKYGEVVKYVEWNENGKFSKLFDEPMIGRSIIINPHYMVYTWLTTEITSFEYEGDMLKFNTKNSKYILETIKSE